MSKHKKRQKGVTYSSLEAAAGALENTKHVSFKDNKDTPHIASQESKKLALKEIEQEAKFWQEQKNKKANPDFLALAEQTIRNATLEQAEREQKSIFSAAKEMPIPQKIRDDVEERFNFQEAEKITRRGIIRQAFETMPTFKNSHQASIRHANKTGLVEKNTQPKNTAFLKRHGFLMTTKHAALVENETHHYNQAGSQFRK